MNSRGIAKAGSLLMRLLPYRRPLIVAVHLLLTALAYLSAFLLRFEFAIPESHWDFFIRSLPALLAIRLAIFGWFRLYEGLWRYVSVLDLIEMAKAVTLGSIVFITGLVVVSGHHFPRSVMLLDWVFCFVFVAAARVVARIAHEKTALLKHTRDRRALIVGAGDAAERLIREINKNVSLDYEVLGMVDDDKRKQGCRLQGVPVIGTTADLPRLCQQHRVDEVLLAIPSAGVDDRKRIVGLCRQAGVTMKTVPSIADLFSGRAGIAYLRDISPEDVLGRTPVHIDSADIVRAIGGKTVLVTGAGGSIGSELCRQLAGMGVGTLVMYERAESSVFFLDLELKERYPSVVIVPVVGDVLDEAKLNETMSRWHPDVVYHAAAYKHVPLMEANPLEAIRNNVFGTEMVMRAGEQFGVERFVLISTDKAVRPVSVMGRTKRLAEDLLRLMNNERTTYVSVRFGNVLGSAGSVMPLFQWQIANGGPVTITHPEATRYFMLIAEAAQLVIQSGVMGKGGEIFFLDMGEPVKVMELASSLMRLSGFHPGEDLEVRTIGLRPGERMNEELVAPSETFARSGHERIFVVQERPPNPRLLAHGLEELRVLVERREVAQALSLLTILSGEHLDKDAVPLVGPGT